LQIGAHGEQNVPPRDRDGHHGRCELGLIVDDKRLAMLEPPRPAMQMCPLPSYPTLLFLANRLANFNICTSIPKLVEGKPRRRRKKGDLN